MGIVKTAQTNRCILVNYVKLVSCVLTRKSVKLMQLIKRNAVKGIRHKRERDFRESLGGAKRQNGFCDITREHPSEILNIFNIRAKVSRDVIFTLQKKLFENDSDERLQLVINAVIQSGTTEDKSAFVIQEDSKGVFYFRGT